MKEQDTIFEIGMEVYDQVNYPNKKGEVKYIETYPSDEKKRKYPIMVKFEDTLFEEFYTLDGRFELGQIPTLSTEPYEIILKGFEQKKSKPTYEIAVKWVESNGDYNPAYVEVNEKEKMFLSKEDFYAFDALRKLIILREYYNEGWHANWENDDEYKYVILTQNDSIEYERNYSYRRVLAFKTPEVRNKFLEDQKELLEIAKPLL